MPTMAECSHNSFRVSHREIPHKNKIVMTSSPRSQVNHGKEVAPGWDCFAPRTACGSSGIGNRTPFSGSSFSATGKEGVSFRERCCSALWPGSSGPEVDGEDASGWGDDGNLSLISRAGCGLSLSGIGNRKGLPSPPFSGSSFSATGKEGVSFRERCCSALWPGSSGPEVDGEDASGWGDDGNLSLISRAGCGLSLSGIGNRKGLPSPPFSGSSFSATGKEGVSFRERCCSALWPGSSGPEVDGEDASGWGDDGNLSLISRAGCGLSLSGIGNRKGLPSPPFSGSSFSATGKEGVSFRERCCSALWPGSSGPEVDGEDASGWGDGNLSPTARPGCGPSSSGIRNRKDLLGLPFSSWSGFESSSAVGNRRAVSVVIVLRGRMREEPVCCPCS